MKNLFLFASICVFASVLPLVAGYWTASTQASEGFERWPAEWRGASLRRIPLTWKEERFAQGFPGQIAHFTDGRQVHYVMRYTSRATRSLLPAADCFRDAGYKVKPLPVFVDDRGDRWSALEARKDLELLRVTERVFENGGTSWIGPGDWYLTAAYGFARGPWWTVTMIEKISE